MFAKRFTAFSEIARGTPLSCNGLKYEIMLDFFEAVKARHSIRSFQSRPVEEEKVNRIIETVNLAPSAGNLQAYEIVVVKDSNRKNKLARLRADKTSLERRLSVSSFWHTLNAPQGSMGGEVPSSTVSKTRR